MNTLIKNKKHIMISTGMSNYKEIDLIYKKLKKYNVSFSLLHCTSKYPTPDKEIGLNVISEFKKIFSTYRIF